MVIGPLEEKSPEKGVGTDNLGMLVDVYKHHWDLFLKGVGLYFVSVSVVFGFALSKEATVFVKLPVSFVILSASVIALVGIAVSINFLREISHRIDRICLVRGYESIPFSGPINIVRLFQVASFFILIASILYMLHVWVLEDGSKEFRNALCEKYRIQSACGPTK